jgi:hypothetical protein
VLSGPVDLPDGAEVEVRPIAPAPASPEDRAREDAFLQHLLASRRISALPTGEPDPPGMDRSPIEILSGPPVSQTIIEERR